MKTVLALAGIAVVLVAVPWWSGGVAVAGFHEIDAAIAQGTQGQLLSSSRVERGILRSFATTELRRAPDAEHATAGTPILVRHTIFHGPLPLGELLHGRLPRGIARAVVETAVSLPDLDPDRVIATLTTRVAWNGLTRVELDAPPYEREGPRIRWSGATGSLVADDVELTRVAGFLHMPSLEVAVGDRRGVIEEIQLEFDAEPSGVSELGVGGGSMRVGRVLVQTEDDDIELTGLEWSHRNQLDAQGETFSSTFSADLTAFAATDAHYGPGRFELVLRNLDPKVLAELQTLANDDAGEPSLDADALAEKATSQLTALLARSPELEITELAFTSPEGDLVGTGRARIDGDSPALAMGPLGAIAALSAEADVRVPTRLFHTLVDGMLANRATRPASAGARIEAAAQRSEWIDQLLAADYLQRTADGYRLRIAFVSGEIRLNGRTIDPTLLSPTRGT